jgi:hypothetical protein
VTYEVSYPRCIDCGTAGAVLHSLRIGIGAVADADADADAHPRPVPVGPIGPDTNEVDIYFTGAIAFFRSTKTSATE